MEALGVAAKVLEFEDIQREPGQTQLDPRAVAIINYIAVGGMNNPGIADACLKAIARLFPYPGRKALGIREDTVGQSA